MAESFHDPEALLREAGWLHGLTRRLALDPHAAEDLAQDTWVAALGAREGARGAARPWLRGIARNLLTRRLRRPEPRTEAAPEALASAEATPDELMARAELQQRVLAAVNTLDEAHRAVVLLHHHEGAPLEEVARRLAVPASTVRSRLQRAHARLREALDRDYHERGAWLALVPLGTGELAPVLPLEVMGMTTASKIALTGAVAVTAGIAVWRGVESTPSRTLYSDAFGNGYEIDHATGERRLISDPEAAESEVPRTRSTALTAEALDAGADVQEEPEAADDHETARVLEDLRSAMERSIGEVMNPSALLDAALMLAESDASDRAVPEPNPSGWMSFPLIDVPEGVEAHLLVAPPTSNPRFARVLALEMALTDLEEPYYVAGTPRVRPTASVTVWLGHDGEPLHAGFQSDLDIDTHEARKRGMLEGLTFTQNAYYAIDMNDPAKESFKTGGTENGQWFGNRDVPVVLEGRPLSHAHVERLGRRLELLYAGIRGTR